MGTEGRLMVPLGPFLPMHAVINNNSIVQERYWNGYYFSFGISFSFHKAGNHSNGT